MAGELIAMLRVLRLKSALEATVTSPEFRGLGVFLDNAWVVLTEEFWVLLLLFLLCRAVYPQLRILRLVDQKVPAMDKLAYYIAQANRLTPKFLTEVEGHVSQLSNGIIEIIGSVDDVASEELEEEGSSDEGDSSDEDDGVDNADEDGDDVVSIAGDVNEEEVSTYSSEQLSCDWQIPNSALVYCRSGQEIV